MSTVFSIDRVSFDESGGQPIKIKVVAPSVVVTLNLSDEAAISFILKIMGELKGYDGLKKYVSKWMEEYGWQS